jgi:hypothetical protein
MDSQGVSELALPEQTLAPKVQASARMLNSSTRPPTPKFDPDATPGVWAIFHLLNPDAVSHGQGLKQRLEGFRRQGPDVCYLTPLFSFGKVLCQ